MCNHVGKLAKQLRGSERADMKKVLLAEKPEYVRQKEMLKADEGLVMQGNLQTAYSNATFRKARAEALAIGDLATDDFDDIKLHMKKDHAEDPALKFYQELGLPFYVLMYSYNQVQMAVRRNRPIFHWDATGSVVRRMSSTVYFIIVE